jgi:hypothetical protein
LPFKLNNDWKGNKYLSDDPYASLYTFFNDDNMNEWDYSMDKFDNTTTIGGKTYNDVYTVFQIDESINAPVTNNAQPGYRTLASDKFAKNIGLVARDFIMWEYQPPPPVHLQILLVSKLVLASKCGWLSIINSCF